MANLLLSWRLAVPAALVLMTPSCGYDLPTTVVGRPVGTPRLSWMSARVEGESWNAVFVHARRDNDFLTLEGTAWVGDETTLLIRMTIKAVADATPQVIDSSSAIAANVVYDPTYYPRQSWTAFGTLGSGTFTISSLTETGATGKFSFTARALTANSLPQDYRVTEGTFDVRF